MMQAIKEMQKRQVDFLGLDLGTLCVASNKKPKNPVPPKDVSQLFSIGTPLSTHPSFVLRRMPVPAVRRTNEKNQIRRRKIGAL